MKTWILTGLFLGFLSGMSAQDHYDYSNPAAVEPAPAPAIVYEAPVTYAAPVVYQAPVAYYAPVFYMLTPGQIAALCQPPPPPCPPPCPAPSTVTFIGGNGPSYTIAHWSSPCPTVIHFGGAQAAAQGYQFNRPR